jgi:hypothetical protein
VELHGVAQLGVASGHGLEPTADDATVKKGLASTELNFQLKGGAIISWITLLQIVRAGSSAKPETPMIGVI